MKLRLTLILFCLLGAGLFAHSQEKKKATKPIVENGPDAIPVTVQSHKKAHHRKPPPPPPLGKDGKPLPPPHIGVTKSAPPRIVKDGEKPPPPPPPAKHTKTKPSAPDAPPPPPEKTEL